MDEPLKPAPTFVEDRKRFDYVPLTFPSTAEKFRSAFHRAGPVSFQPRYTLDGARNEWTALRHQRIKVSALRGRGNATMAPANRFSVLEPTSTKRGMHGSRSVKHAGISLPLRHSTPFHWKRLPLMFSLSLLSCRGYSRAFCGGSDSECPIELTRARPRGGSPHHRLCLPPRLAGDAQ